MARGIQFPTQSRLIKLKTLKKIHSFFRGAGGFQESEQGSKADCFFTGIAFPTSISVNNCVCHFSPLKSDQDYILKEGDLVKIDLGVHVDGFIANVAHTSVVDVAQGTQVTGRKADVIKAAHLCAEAALRLVKPGNQVSCLVQVQSLIKPKVRSGCTAILY